MSEKQAKLKKVTNILFLVVTVIVAGWFLLNGLFNNKDYIYGSKVFNFFSAGFTVLSTILYYFHIRFKRSIPIGIANLLFLSYSLIIFEYDVTTFEDNVNIAVLGLVIAAYAIISSIYFFSNEKMRYYFQLCPISFCVLNMFGSFLAITDRESASLFITMFMILAYVIYIYSYKHRINRL